MRRKADSLDVGVPDIDVPLPHAVFFPPIHNVFHFHLAVTHGEIRTANFDNAIAGRQRIHGGEDNASQTRVDSRAPELNDRGTSPHHFASRRQDARVLRIHEFQYFHRTARYRLRSDFIRSLHRR